MPSFVLALVLLTGSTFVHADSPPDAGAPAASAPPAATAECTRRLGELAATMDSLLWSCTSKCSQSNLWILQAIGSGPSADAAYRSLDDICANRNSAVVQSRLTCMSNFGRDDYHEELRDNCEARVAAISAALTTPRFKCTAVARDRFHNPYYVTATGSNTPAIFTQIAQEADRHDLSIDTFLLDQQCAYFR